jgi:hypothetical protein
MASEARKYKVDIQMHTYGFERNNRSYLYVRCVHCAKIKLKFLKTNSDQNIDGAYRLMKYDNTHSHLNYVRKKKTQYNMQ